MVKALIRDYLEFISFHFPHLATHLWLNNLYRMVYKWEPPHEETAH